MRIRHLFPLCLLILAGCIKEASDPYLLAPSSPYATWTPLKGNCLVSSRYCKTMLPPEFDSHDLSLAELIDIALRNNPATRISWASALNAASAYGVSLSSFFPDLSFNASYFRQRSNQPGSTSPTATGSTQGGGGAPTPSSGGTFLSTGFTDQPVFFTQAGPGLELAYTLFDFGQRTAAVAVAREALYYADLTHNQQIQTTLQTVMNDYYNYLYQIALVKSGEADLANAQSSLDAANQKFALGLAALGDVAQARTQFLQNKINLTTQKQNVENAFAQLSADIGLPSNVPFKVQPLPDQIIADPLLESVDQLVLEAQNRRQDFLAAQADLRSKDAAILAAKRASNPVINVDLNVGRYYYTQGLHEDYHWTATLGLYYPIFTGFWYRNKVKAAEAERESSAATLLKTELGMIQDVTNAHMNIKTSALNLNDSMEYLKAAQLEYDIALAGYKAGTSTILDLMSAQSNIADARSKKAGAQKDWLTALAALAHATGSLCATPCETPSEETECVN